MRVIQLLLVAAVAAGAYHHWRKQPQAADTAADASAANSDYGFVAMPPVAGADRAAVLVIAAEDCPHDDAQRADRLAEDLSRNGVPVRRAHDLSFTLDGPDSAQVARVQSLMNGPLPIVFVRGRTKSNPSLDEVLAEYRAKR